MLAIIAIGCYGGVKLDEVYPNKQSWFTIICSLLSVAIAMYWVIRQVSNSSKNNNE
ncbi:MAG: AtpZ/AtpI family protein [Flavobacteriaceae bacterium]|nr:AtpZ/AtpI family protein [Flavobacteriaceae bacterium]